MSELINQCIPPDLIEAAKTASINLLPVKSRDKYIAIYNKFIEGKRLKTQPHFPKMF